MVSAELLERLEQAGRELRSSDRPFGGVQLVLSGDFFQLRRARCVLPGVLAPSLGTAAAGNGV